MATSPNLPPASSLLTVNQAAAKAGLSPTRIRRQIYAGTLDAQFLSPFWVITPESLALFRAQPRPHGVRKADRVAHFARLSLVNPGTPDVV